MKILIVEDDALNRKLYQDVLALNGYETVHSVDGRNVAELIEEHNPAAIIMDIRLPYKNGLEITRHIKSHPIHRNIPVIAATSFSSDENRQKCMESGFDAFLTKPLSIWILIETVSRLVALPQLTLQAIKAEELACVTC